MQCRHMPMQEQRAPRGQCPGGGIPGLAVGKWALCLLGIRAPAESQRSPTRGLPLHPAHTTPPTVLILLKERASSDQGTSSPKLFTVLRDAGGGGPPGEGIERRWTSTLECSFYNRLLGIFWGLGISTVAIFPSPKTNLKAQACRFWEAAPADQRRPPSASLLFCILLPGRTTSPTWGVSPTLKSSRNVKASVSW